MRIASSDITMSSAQMFIERHERRETLSVWTGPRVPVTQEPRKDPLLGSSATETRLPRGGKSNRGGIRCKPKGIEGRSEETDGIGIMDSRLYVTKMLIERLTGRKIRILDASSFDRESEDQNVSVDRDLEHSGPSETEEGWGLQYSRYESHYESEQTGFYAEGMIRTQEGKEIRFVLQLQMRRDVLSEEGALLRAGDAAKIDPLVINFNGSAAELTDMRFTFDLDADGREEAIPLVRPGSGFLAFDVNQDGRINNGDELFGPRTGNGFAELAVHDRDRNNWIDENDPVYDALSIWTRDQEGNDTLTSLREGGVGAIYLASMGSAFHLRDAANHPVGEIGSTGIYVLENGGVGTIQQVDLVV